MFCSVFGYSYLFVLLLQAMPVDQARGIRSLCLKVPEVAFPLQKQAQTLHAGKSCS